jgi:hypothetical protein
MLEVLTNPNGFFHKKINENVEMKTPLIIMAAMIVVNAIIAALIAQKTMEMIPEVAEYASIAMGFAVIGSIFGVMFNWLIYSGIFHLASMIFNGNGEFRRVLEFTAYGFIPSILGSAISAYYTLPVYNNLNFSDPLMMEEILTSSPSIKIATVIGLIFLLWSANIWVFALSYSRNISVKNAAIIIGLPVLLYILYVLSRFYL